MILTLRIDEANQAYFNELRRRYFPSERNYLDAHLTLFHNISGFDGIFQQPGFRMETTGVFSIGNGVAYRIESPDLLRLREKLAKKLELIPQDRQAFRPHITIQNKVNPEVAKITLMELSAVFEPFAIKATGLDLWHYLGGPWAHEQFYPFSPST